MSKSTEVGVNAAVLNYLNKQNRPYSAVDILNNLHKEFGKTALIKSLDQLVAQGAIKSKNYNKQIVYVADQQQFPEIDDAEIKSMDRKIADLEEKLRSSAAACKTLEADLQKNNITLTTENAILKLKELDSECEQLCEKLNGFKSNKGAVDPKKRESIVECRVSNGREWRKRKRVCNEMMNVILEGYPKSKKAFIDEVGIETDENAGVQMYAV